MRLKSTASNNIMQIPNKGIGTITKALRNSIQFIFLYYLDEINLDYFEQKDGYEYKRQE